MLKEEAAEHRIVRSADRYLDWTLWASASLPTKSYDIFHPQISHCWVPCKTWPISLRMTSCCAESQLLWDCKMMPVKEHIVTWMKLKLILLCPMCSRRHLGRFWDWISIQVKKVMGKLRTRGIHEISFTPHLKCAIGPILSQHITKLFVQDSLTICQNQQIFCFSFFVFSWKLPILTLALLQIPSAYG